MPQLHGALRQGRGADRACRAHALSRAARISTGRTCSRAACAGVARIDDGWLNRALAQLPCRRAGPIRVACRSGAVVPLRDARPGPGAVLDPARSTACRCANPPSPGSWTSTPRPIRCWPGRLPRAWRSTASPTRSRAAAGQPARARPDARRAPQPRVHRGRGGRRPLPLHRRRAAHRRAELQRLGHACQRGPHQGPARPAARQPSTPPSPPARPAWVRRGRRRSPSSSPSSAAQRASTAPQGTDHGMATVALLVGGAVKGGRVLADWPGLRDSALYEGRDLAPTRDLRAVLKGVLRDHLGVPEGALAGGDIPRQCGSPATRRAGRVTEKTPLRAQTWTALPPRNLPEQPGLLTAKATFAACGAALGRLLQCVSLLGRDRNDASCQRSEEQPSAAASGAPQDRSASTNIPTWSTGGPSGSRPWCA